MESNTLIKWICDLCFLATCIYLYSGLHSRPVTTGNFTNTCKPSMASKVIVTLWRFSGSLSKVYPRGEWNINWIKKTGGEK